MPTEAELRRILQGEPDAPAELDTARIIRRARARRLPKQIAAGGTGILAAAALVVPVVLGVGALSTSGSFLGAAGGGPAADQSLLMDGPSTDDAELQGGAREQVLPAAMSAEGTQQCAAAVVEHEPDGALTSTISSPASAGGETAMVTVALANTGDTAISGTMDELPTVAIARDGVVVATSAAAGAEQAERPLELAAGATLVMSVWVPLMQCDPAGGPALGALSAGAYTLSAAIDVTTSDGAVLLVTGPASPFEVRVP